jgi:hypothetical protein
MSDDLYAMMFGRPMMPIRRQYVAQGPTEACKHVYPATCCRFCRPDLFEPARPTEVQQIHGADALLKAQAARAQTPIASDGRENRKPRINVLLHTLAQDLAGRGLRGYRPGLRLIHRLRRFRDLCCNVLLASG